MVVAHCHHLPRNERRQAQFMRDVLVRELQEVATVDGLSKQLRGRALHVRRLQEAPDVCTPPACHLLAGGSLLQHSLDTPNSVSEN